ncbi:MAG: Wzz/FepE/Etk N-terminal domain-containing protein [Clostridia bacterium]
MKKEVDIIEIDLQEIFMQLVYKAWIIILSVIICGAISFTYTKVTVDPLYSSDAMLFVNATSSISGIDIKVGVSDVSSGSSLISTYKVILNTRQTLSEIIDYVGLDYSTSQLASMISINSVDSTSVFQVSVSNTDPNLAEEIATAIVEILPNKISSIIDGTSVRIVDTAIVPSYPYSPNYQQSALTGAFVGFMLSACCIVLLKLLDKRITAVDYVKNKYEDIPVLGVIPCVSPNKKN